MSISLELHSTETRLQRPVVMLNEVGPQRASLLVHLGVRTVSDLLLLRPRRYEDRRQPAVISALQLYTSALVRAKILELGVKRYARGRKSVFELVLDDGTGRLYCRWWNMPHMQQHFERGNELLVFGRVSGERPRTMDHPEVEMVETGQERLIHVDRIVPVYPLTEGLSQRWLRRLLFNAVHEYAPAIADPRPAPAEFPRLAEAVQQLHFPTELEHVERARRRLALEEWVHIQLTIQTRRHQMQAAAPGLICRGDNRWIKPFLRQLGFSPTRAQKKVLAEIRSDLGRGIPMRRLLQGDVGSGKTLVAVCAALMVLESGWNVVVMAPTEILAEQHHANFRRWLEPLGITVALWTGARKGGADVRAGQRRSDAPSMSQTRANAGATEPVCLTVGTHALAEQGFSQENLGLVIIDEQHKFGVTQREKVLKKGRYPHLLVMTATPIPRTLALTLYGELEVSCIDELPSGRRPIKTFVRTSESLPKVWDFVRSKLETGQQAYVVYARIDEGRDGGIQAAATQVKQLEKALTPHRVALMHGRLKSVEKESVMSAFRDRKVDVLATTAVIEVGVDVPNATVLVVQNAEQFGLAQLHQLRGRIGRGSTSSYCVLVTGQTDSETMERLQILEESTDGFAIAEADLRLRGPGDIVGRDQSGIPPLRFANWAGDMDLLESARAIAERELRRTNNADPKSQKKTSIPVSGS